ncbi:mitochondrial intermembrane space import and assembly 40 homolog isoform X2 [Olea europaea subsp. europaea]|uniref:Mitochondrial intermembrane space import and assembly 40 homolog isoform X2 n=1 Tax=Olea europaea subsp. europaea TaxID=158383 RepID=A0A8S0URH4_OLEEU|nr:mitochondrial intermembrane space import and assembly 40 homolog isoform X2 [Olea europaea subsp. europaea]
MVLRMRMKSGSEGSENIGTQFSNAYVCFLKSPAEGKGRESVHPFVALQNCIKANPDAFSEDILEDDEVEKEEKPSQEYSIRPPLWSIESKTANHYRTGEIQGPFTSISHWVK